MSAPELWFHCVADAVCSRGQAALTGRAPLAAVAAAVNGDALARLNAHLPDGTSAGDVLAAVAQLDDINTASLAQAVAETSTLPEDQRQKLADYLLQVPAAVRATLRRPSEPDGRTIPNGWSPAQGPPMTPTRLPQFRVGQRPLEGLDFELVEFLGAGGFGEVWKARNAAVKHLPPVALKFCLDPVTHTHLHQHEAQVAALVGQVPAVSGQDGVVPLRNAYLGRNPPCLEYEYILGGDLAALMREWLAVGPPPYRPATEVIRRLARVVGALHRHARQVIHRDLKPSNVLVQHLPDGGFALRVADFGISGVASTRALDRERTGETSQGEFLTAALLGTCTPLYASPQQKQGAKAEPRDDVHALGVMWFQLLIGDVKRAVSADLEDELNELGLARELIAILKACVASKAERRPKDGVELAERIEQATQVRQEPIRELDHPTEKSDDRPPSVTVPSRPHVIVGTTGRSDCATLSEAIELVSPGGQITLEAGEHTGRGRILKDLTVVAEPGARLVSMVGSCLRIEGGNVTVRALNILGGSTGSESAAVEVVRGRLELVACEIIGRRFAGLRVSGDASSVVAERCRFHDANDRDASVDGVLLAESARATFERCHIYANSRNGLEARTRASVMMRNCQLYRNGYSGLRFHSISSGSIEDCEIRENGFSGVALWPGADPVVRKCRIRANGHAAVTVGTDDTGVVEECDLTGNAQGAFLLRRAGCSLHRVTANLTDTPSGSAAPATDDVGKLWQQAQSLAVFDEDAAIDLASQVLAKVPLHQNARELLISMHMKRAERCAKNGLLSEILADCQAVLKIDPHHAVARQLQADVIRVGDLQVRIREKQFALLLLLEVAVLPEFLAVIGGPERLDELSDRICNRPLQEAIVELDTGRTLSWRLWDWRDGVHWKRIPQVVKPPSCSDAREDSRYLREQALMHQIHGDTESVEHLLREATSRFPDDAAAHHYLGLALALQGNSDASRSHLHRALDLTDEPATRTRVQRALRVLA